MKAAIPWLIALAALGGLVILNFVSDQAEEPVVLVATEEPTVVATEKPAAVAGARPGAESRPG